MSKMTEVCYECGHSVAWGSTRFVNRVPSLDDEETRAEGGAPYPQGDFLCSTCDEDRYSEVSNA